MEQFLTYFPSAFSWGNLAVLILGSAGGLFFGAMPGLSPTMAVALLVPFTFYLPADTSLILLGAVYTSAVAGGSISAILLSIPGAPSSIATLFDGYPMAKQGRAQEALYTVFVSSLIGGVFGVLVMILFSPPMAEFAMRFVINGMKTSGKKRDNLGSIGKSFRRGCNSIAESATKKEGNQPSFFVGG